jgi:predicted nucleotidyltransferase
MELGIQEGAIWISSSTFLPEEPPQHADSYFGLWFALEDFFHRKVDLVETTAIQNPYSLRSIDQSRKVLCAGAPP